MTGAASIYPERDRTEWILAQRPARMPAPDPYAAHGVFLERERLATGEVARTGVVLLTNRECPWRCLMCDLWKHTTTETVPEGAIVQQVAAAVRTWTAEGVRPAQVKLYNSGSFFDPSAIPVADYAGIAREISFAKNVVVESHPLLVGERTWQFKELLAGSLEVALGLETAHPEILRKLNKKFDWEQFARAAAQLAKRQVELRVFLLVNPPFLRGAEAAEWVVKSASFAYDCGATAVTLIPTRPGNGAIEKLQEAGECVPPTLSELEDTLDKVLALGRGRAFADTWGLEPFSACSQCLAERRARLEEVNLAQRAAPRISCERCGGK